MFRSSFIAVALAASVFSGAASASVLVDFGLKTGDTTKYTAPGSGVYLGDDFQNVSGGEWTIKYISVFTTNSAYTTYSNNTSSLSLSGMTESGATMAPLGSSFLGSYYAGDVTLGGTSVSAYRVDFGVNLKLANGDALMFLVDGVSDLLGQNFASAPPNTYHDYFVVVDPMAFIYDFSNDTDPVVINDHNDLNFLAGDVAPPPFAVPEPTSLALFGVAMAGLLTARRRKV